MTLKGGLLQATVHVMVVASLLVDACLPPPGRPVGPFFSVFSGLSPVKSALRTSTNHPGSLFAELLVVAPDSLGGILPTELFLEIDIESGNITLGWPDDVSFSVVPPKLADPTGGYTMELVNTTEGVAASLTAGTAKTILVPLDFPASENLTLASNVYYFVDSERAFVLYSGTVDCNVDSVSDLRCTSCPTCTFNADFAVTVELSGNGTVVNRKQIDLPRGIGLSSPGPFNSLLDVWDTINIGSTGIEDSCGGRGYFSYDDAGNVSSAIAFDPGFLTATAPAEGDLVAYTFIQIEEFGPTVRYVKEFRIRRVSLITGEVLEEVPIDSDEIWKLSGSQQPASPATSPGPQRTTTPSQNASFAPSSSPSLTDKQTSKETTQPITAETSTPTSAPFPTIPIAYTPPTPSFSPRPTIPGPTSAPFPTIPIAYTPPSPSFSRRPTVPRPTRAPFPTVTIPFLPPSFYTTRPVLVEPIAQPTTAPLNGTIQVTEPSSTASPVAEGNSLSPSTAGPSSATHILQAIPTRPPSASRTEAPAILTPTAELSTDILPPTPSSPLSSIPSVGPVDTAATQRSPAPTATKPGSLPPIPVFVSPRQPASMTNRSMSFEPTTAPTSIPARTAPQSLPPVMGTNATGVDSPTTQPPSSQVIDPAATAVSGAPATNEAAPPTLPPTPVFVVSALQPASSTTNQSMLLDPTTVPTSIPGTTAPQGLPAIIAAPLTPVPLASNAGGEDGATQPPSLRRTDPAGTAASAAPTTNLATSIAPSATLIVIPPLQPASMTNQSFPVDSSATPALPPATAPVASLQPIKASNETGPTTQSPTAHQSIDPVATAVSGAPTNTKPEGSPPFPFFVVPPMPPTTMTNRSFPPDSSPMSSLIPESAAPQASAFVIVPPLRLVQTMSNSTGSGTPTQPQTAQGIEPAVTNATSAPTTGAAPAISPSLPPLQPASTTKQSVSLDPTAVPSLQPAPTAPQKKAFTIAPSLMPVQTPASNSSGSDNPTVL